MISERISDTKTQIFGSLLLVLFGITAASWHYLGTDAANVIVSAGLSAALVALYFYQSTIQEYQSQLMKGQNELKSAEYAPEIDIEEFAPLSKSSGGFVSKDSVSLGLVNYGSGVAKAPELIVKISFDDSSDIKTISNYIPLHRSPKTTPPGPQFKNLTKLIPSNGDMKRFDCPVQATYSKGTHERTELHFREFAEKVYEEGEEQMMIELGISVRNMLDEEFEYNFLKFEVDIQNLPEDPLNSEMDEEDIFRFANIFRFGMAREGQALVGDGIPVPPTEPTDKTAEIIVRSINSAINADREFEN